MTTKKNIERVLIIQTAFIGDVVLATPVIEALNQQLPHVKIDFLLRKGNENLLSDHPGLNQVLVWDKKNNKYKGLYQILKKVREKKYDLVINLQRFASTGLITALSKAEQTIGFKSNPYSFLFSKKVDHLIGDFTHETERNLSTLKPLFGEVKAKPKLYPTPIQKQRVKPYQQIKYICAAPTSVWFTKQYPIEKWIQFFNKINPHLTTYLLGAPNDAPVCDEIIGKSKNKKMENLAGKISLLESAWLMQGAEMNFVNDSAPMHLASALNAPTTAIYCSTLPAFGFGPLSDNSAIVETKEFLPCRPCGLHGKKSCPEGHFKCAHTINTDELLARI